MSLSQEIAWGDGSGDKIYITAGASEGNQTVQVSSDPNTGAARTKTITFSASGVSPVTLTVNQEAGGLPYTPVDYIQTDGTAYINTGIAGSAPKSSELKVLIPDTTNCVMLGKGNINTSSQVQSMFVLLYMNGSRACFGFRFRYLTGAPDISDSIANNTPFVVRTQMKAGSQLIGVKEEGDTTWTELAKTQSSAPTGTDNMYLFRDNYSSAPLPCPSGSRVYYCKIYSDYNMSSLVFDGIPCYYNGAYGLWDNVSNSFFGNASNNGAFTGPSV